MCNNFHNKKTDRYCVQHRKEYQIKYRNKMFEAKLKETFQPKLVPSIIPMIDETIGTNGTTILPLYWSDKSRLEWSTRYSSKNWKFNLHIH